MQKYTVLVRYCRVKLTFTAFTRNQNTPLAAVGIKYSINYYYTVESTTVVQTETKQQLYPTRDTFDLNCD